MSVQATLVYTASGTLAAGVTTTLTIDMLGARLWSMAVKNTGGTNAITTVTITRSPLGGIYCTDGVTVNNGNGAAAGATVIFEQPFIATATRFMKVALVSTSGTTYSLELIGY